MKNIINLLVSFLVAGFIAAPHAMADEPVAMRPSYVFQRIPNATALSLFGAPTGNTPSVFTIQANGATEYMMEVFNLEGTPVFTIDQFGHVFAANSFSGSFDVQNTVGFEGVTPPPLSAIGHSTLYYDSVTQQLMLSQNGQPYVPVIQISGGLPVGSPAMGTSRDYAILAASAVTGSTGAGSTLIGDLGEYPGSTISNFPPSTVSGTTNSGNLAAQVAQASALTAYTDLSTRVCPGPNHIPNDLDGQSLVAGVYCFSAGDVNLASAGVATLTLTGTASDIFVFQVPSTLTTGAGGTPTITLAGGALASNVYWAVGTSATINSGNPGVFNGNVLAHTSITVTSGGTVNGSLIALTGAATLSATTTINSQPVSGPSSGITSLTGDVTAAGTGSVPATVAFVGGASAASVASTVTTVAAATSLDTPSTLVKRDANSNFDISQITINGEAAPALSSAGTGSVYFDSGSNQLMLSQNGGAYSPIMTGATGADVHLDNLASPTSVNQDLIPQGVGAHNLGSIGNPWNTGYFNNTVQTGTLQSGVLASAGGTHSLTWNFPTNTSLIPDTDNVINLGSAGVRLRSVHSAILDTSQTVIFGEPAPALSGAGTASIYFDSGSNLLELSQNGGAYSPITTAATGADVHLDNLSATAVNADISPAVDGTTNLGSPTFRWQNIYATQGVFFATWFNAAGSQSVHWSSTDILPQINLNTSLGSPSQQFNSLYVGKTVATSGLELSTSGAQPTCVVGIRGLQWIIQGGAGVADIYQICEKNAADAYVWVSH